MARLGALDFDSFVARRRREGANDPPPVPRVRDESGEHGYAYTSDTTTRLAFERVKPLELAITASVRSYRAFRGQVLGGSAVRVGPRQFPRVHELGQSCASTLGIAPPTMYIVNQPTLNAMTYGTNDDSFILIHSALVDHLSDDELLDVIGHECGHIHNNHVVYLTTFFLLHRIGGLVAEYIAFPAMLALRAWMRRAEITCDRAGLLCSKDINVATRSLAKLALGSHKLYEQLDLEEFVSQVDDFREGPGQLMEALSSHPWLPKRILALREFAASALYRKHVNLGAGGLTMGEVDAKVTDIIKVLG